MLTVFFIIMIILCCDCFKAERFNIMRQDMESQKENRPEFHPKYIIYLYKNK